MAECQLSPLWEECVDRINEFPNLTSVELCFARHAGQDEDEDIYQRPYLRNSIVERLFRAVHSLQKQNGLELAIRHFQIWSPDCPGLEDNVIEGVCKEVLGRLKKLRMSLVHEVVFPEGGTMLRVSLHLSHLASGVFLLPFSRTD